MIGSPRPATPLSLPCQPAARTILVVDDDLHVGTALRYSIGAAGFRVLVATSGKQALRLANETTVHAALIDFEMHPMDGIDVCRRLIAEQSRREPYPIWVMTGYFSSMRWASAIEAGAIDLFPKPFERDRFLAELDMAWSAHQSGRRPGESNIRLAPSF